MENNLPNNWIEARLTEDLDYLATGVEEYSGSKKYYSTGSIQENSVLHEGEFTYYNRPSRANRLAKMGDVLQARMKNTDKGLLIDETLDGQLFSTGFIQIRPVKDYINAKYLFYFIKSDIFLNQRDELATGSTQEALTDNKAKEIIIPLAPFKEQQRIVEKLDTLIERVNKNRARLEKITTLLKNFRQSVLAAALNGELTDSDTNIWTETKLSNVIIDKPKNGYSAKPVSYKTNYRVLTLTATTSGIFKPEHFKYFDENIDEESPFWLKPNDILVQRGNTIEYVGVPAIYNGKPNEYIYPDLMMKLRANESIILTKYLYIVLSSEESRQYLRERATGTAGNMPKINQPTLISLPIKYPTLQEQREIVDKVEKLFQFAHNTEVRYQKAKVWFDKLPQAILAKAFRGELVAQDENDESASELLEKIKEAKKEQIELEKNIKKDKASKKKSMNHQANVDLNKELKSRFKKSKFKFDDISNILSSNNYDELKADFFKSIKEKLIEMSYNSKEKKIYFKFK